MVSEADCDWLADWVMLGDIDDDWDWLELEVCDWLAAWLGVLDCVWVRDGLRVRDIVCEAVMVWVCVRV